MTAVETPTVPGSTARATRRPRRQRTRRRRPVRRLWVLTHRWSSLVVGLVLLVETTTGAILVYKPELHRAQHGSAYAAADAPATITVADAAAIVRRAHPEYDPVATYARYGVYAVTDYETSYNVDPADGRILGFVGEAPSWLLFSENLHECAFTCEGEPGYVAWLTDPVPHTAWLGDEGEELTWGGLLLGLLGSFLVFLCLSGLWLWFPRPSRWRTGFTVRRGKGRFARDSDLHKVIGIGALLPLLMWGITGAGFELTPLRSAFLAATPGAEHSDPVKAITGTHHDDGRTVTAGQALAIAERAVPGARVRSVSSPEPPPSGRPGTAFDVWLSSAHDPYGRGDYPGDVEVTVSQRTGAATIRYGDPSQPLAQEIWDTWSYPVHTGYVVNGWWRAVWLVLGLTPLALAVTGISTWLVRHGARKRRRAAARARAARTAG